MTTKTTKTMKVMIVNDDDGHASAIRLTVPNLKNCLRHWVSLGEVGGNETEADLLLTDPNVTAEQLESFIRENCPTDRSGGHRLYIVEVSDWKKGWQPWG